ncbi:hypothetical protein OOZ19_22275 [Saccharopolyspora sp. NFXS83]|nr:hypothetical protein [Saccharopolyspora sp. NFXS83]MCX2732975.1 hypothetical protein [Saccharopolyspora sp. NFXS83]
MIDVVAPIKTERPSLRSFAEDDAAEAFTFEPLPEVTRYQYDDPRIRED